MIQPVPQKTADLHMRLKTCAAGLLFAAALIAANAHAEKADREKPINLESDRVSVDDAKQISTFEGRVVLTQGTLIIRGDRMEVRQDAQGFKTGITWGNLAYFRQKREGYDEYIEGWAERIEYDGRADKMQMFNRASMKKAATRCAAITSLTMPTPNSSRSSAATPRPAPRATAGYVP